MIKLDGLEGLRGIMCVWVILSHASTVAASPFAHIYGLGRILTMGEYAVDVFIILSGFVITYLIKSKNEIYSSYLIRRFLRIFPVYLFALFITAALLDYSIDFIEKFPWESANLESRLHLYREAKRNFLSHFSSHVLLLHGLIPNSILDSAPYALMGQAWSLTLELQFYVIAPALLVILERHWIYYIVAFSLLIAVEPVVQRYFGHESFLLANISFFLLGISCCLLFIKKNNGLINEKKYLVLVLLLTAFVLIYKIFVTNILVVIPIMIWFFSLISETCRFKYISSSFVSFVLNNGVSRWLGKVSYSAYCLHMIMLYLTGYLVINIFEVDRRPVYTLIIFTIPVVLTFLFSSFSYRYIEKPFIDFGKKFNVKYRVYNL